MRKERAFLILLLAASVLAPIFFFAAKFSSLYEGGFADDISAAATKEHSNAEPLHVESAEQGEWETVKEPMREVLEDGAVDGNKTIKSVVSGSGRSAGDLPVVNGVRMVDGVGVGILKNATSLTSAKSKRRHILKAGSLPLGQLTFYNNTLALERHWHIHGLGYDPNIGRGEIERAAVIHYDGIMKPWLEIGIAKYKGYWTRFLNYDTPYMLQCNIHP